MSLKNVLLAYDTFKAFWIIVDLLCRATTTDHLAHLPNISLAAAEVRSERVGWTLTKEHCYDRAESFNGDFTANAFYVTKKLACMVIHYDKAKLQPGDDVVYALGNPQTCPKPYYCK